MKHVPNRSDEAIARLEQRALSRARYPGEIFCVCRAPDPVLNRVPRPDQGVIVCQHCHGVVKPK